MSIIHGAIGFGDDYLQAKAYSAAGRKQREGQLRSHRSCAATLRPAMMVVSSAQPELPSHFAPSDTLCDVMCLAG